MEQSQALPAFKVDDLMCKFFKEPLDWEKQEGRGWGVGGWKKLPETVVDVEYNDYFV